MYLRLGHFSANDQMVEVASSVQLTGDGRFGMDIAGGCIWDDGQKIYLIMSHKSNQEMYSFL